MRFLLLALILGVVVLGPFVALKKPWAVAIWRRLRLLFYIYVLAIVIGAIVLLASRWDDFYG